MNIIVKEKKRYTNLRDWKNVTTMLFVKTLKLKKIDKKIGQKEADNPKSFLLSLP